jgi:transposase InsO family protein
VPAFYAWVKTPENTDKTKQEEALRARVQQIFDDNKKTFGSRRLSEALKKEGIAGGRYKISRLMAGGVGSALPQAF